MDIVQWFKAYLAKYQPNKTDCNEEDGCSLKAAVDLYQTTQDEIFRQFVLAYLSARVMEDGVIPNDGMCQNYSASINVGKALFFALEQTGEERYRKAIESQMQRLREHPRCACGSFWHTQLNPWQIWLEGLYMVQPFYMAYEMQFGGMEKVADVVLQFKNVHQSLWNAEKRLHHHAYDERKQMFWADAQSGCSADFWLHSNGWYLMALVDTISLCREELYEHYRALVDLFRESIAGILRYQAENGLFYQMIDRPEAEDNYTETSGSAMVAYALMKGVHLGILDPEKYLPTGKGIFEALVKEKWRPEADGVPHLTDVCEAGLGTETTPQQDGPMGSSLNKPRKSDDGMGVGPFMMAYSEYLRS